LANVAICKGLFSWHELKILKFTVNFQAQVSETTFATNIFTIETSLQNANFQRFRDRISNDWTDVVVIAKPAAHYVKPINVISKCRPIPKFETFGVLSFWNMT
jgi:hypothetical protein